MTVSTDRSRRETYLVGAALVVFVVGVLFVIYIFSKQLPEPPTSAATPMETKAK